MIRETCCNLYGRGPPNAPLATSGFDRLFPSASVDWPGKEYQGSRRDHSHLDIRSRPVYGDGETGAMARGVDDPASRFDFLNPKVIRLCLLVSIGLSRDDIQPLGRNNRLSKGRLESTAAAQRPCIVYKRPR